MSWISTNNLRRFADKLFHGNLSFGGSVTHNGATTFNGGVKVNTTKAEFAAPVYFTGTTTYKGKEIATKADVTTSDLTPYMKKTADSDLDMGNNAIFIGDSSMDARTGDLLIQTTGDVNITTGGDNRYLNVNGDAVATQNYVLGRIPTKTSQLTNDSGYAKTSELIDILYPVGSIYMNATNDTNPATLLGFGTWVRISAGRVLLGAGSSSSGNTYIAGDTGGEEKHTLSVDEIPSHTHSASIGNSGGHNHSFNTTDKGDYHPQINAVEIHDYTVYKKAYVDYAGDHTHSIEINNTGSGFAHNNMQPYLVVYIFQRTA